MRYIRFQFMDKLKGNEGARVRLELMLDGYANTGKLMPHEGRSLNP